MKLTHTLSVLLVSAALVPATAFAEQESAATSQVAAANQKSTKQLRKELWQAEKDFYALYNKLNDDNLYDVRCVREAPTGSVIKIQTCRPKFLDRAMKDAQANGITSLAGNTEIETKMATFRETMKSVVAASPELKTKMAKLNEAHDLVNADKASQAKN